jgi:phage-related protein
MATRYWFKWNGTRSDEMGIILNEAPQIVKPEERVQHVTIPGRSGEVTLTEGDGVYQSYIQTLSIAIRQATNVHTVENWLKGDGMVTFSSQPGLQQAARVIGAVTLQKHSRNLDWWEGEVQFYCSPAKYAVDEEDIEITVSGTEITHPGGMPAYPLIEVNGSGAVTIYCGSRTLIIPECESGWVIDSENEWILENGVPQMGACSGEFPVFQPGVNVITFTGAESLTVTPRFRYL